MLTPTRPLSRLTKAAAGKMTPIWMESDNLAHF